MPSISFSDVFGFSSVALGIVSTWVQFRRARTISVDGISLTTWYQFILLGMFWISYGVTVHSGFLLFGSALVAPLQLGIVMRLEPLKNWRVLLRATLFIVVCSALPTLLFGFSAGVIGTGVAMVANRLPQIIKLIRHPGDLGVAVGSWTVGAASALLWVLYYVGVHLWYALAVTAAGMVGNLVIASLATWRHRQVAAADVCDEKVPLVLANAI
jgi:hypothetical protein